MAGNITIAQEVPEARNLRRRQMLGPLARQAADCTVEIQTVRGQRAVNIGAGVFPVDAPNLVLQ
jgi:hypothetical protein